MTAVAYLSLGSNLGNRLNHIDNAIAHLKTNHALHIAKQSSYYETEPVGVKHETWFINCGLKLQTDLPPASLLHLCQSIEKKLGGEKNKQGQSRIIDIDILLYNDLSLQTTELILPHPRMWERRFVLLPLIEICPHLEWKGKRIQAYLKNGTPEKVVKHSSLRPNYY